jgi:hypothetical protein
MEVKSSIKELTYYLEKNMKIINEDYKEKYKELEQVIIVIKHIYS